VTDRDLPPVKEAFAIWHQGQIRLVLNGSTYADDRVADLTPAQALRLAETLVRSAREALTEWRDEPPGGISKGGVLYLSPERVAAQVEAARREAREACAAVVDCGCIGRNAVLARLESQGEKRASYLCTHGDVCCAIQAAAIRARGDA
jgi:hypothetical protein